MYIYHITSVYAAYQIITSQHFKPYNNPNIPHDDDCLNCFCSNMDEYNTNQAFENEGVILVFEWTGKVQKFNRSLRKPYPPNILYDDKPWRCLIPINSKEKYLRVVRIDFKNGSVDKAFKLPLLVKLLPRYFKNKFYRKYRYSLYKTLRSLYRNNDCHITIY